MLLEKVRYFLSLFTGLLIITIAVFLLLDENFVYGIFLVFAVLIPLKFVFVVTMKYASMRRKLLLLLPSLLILGLSLIWAKTALDELLFGIIFVGLLDGGITGYWWKSHN